MAAKREFLYRDGLTRDFGLVEVREAAELVASLRYRRNEQGRLIASTSHLFLKTDGIRLNEFFDHLNQCVGMPERDRYALRDLRRRFRIVEKSATWQLTWFVCCSRPIEESRARAYPYQGEDFTEEPYHLPRIATTEDERRGVEDRYAVEWPHREQSYLACQVEPTDEPWFPRFQPRDPRDRREPRRAANAGRERRHGAPRGPHSRDRSASVSPPAPEPFSPTPADDPPAQTE